MLTGIHRKTSAERIGIRRSFAALAANPRMAHRG
jgi:hypothetical protein